MKTLMMIMVFALAGTLYAGSIVISNGSLSAKPYGNSIKVTWGSTDESNVQEYGVERSAYSNGGFITVATVTKLLGNNAKYEYIDQTVFKTMNATYYYRIKVVFKNGAVDYSDVSDQASIETSVGKRTWGSIKAMFR